MTRRLFASGLIAVEGILLCLILFSPVSVRYFEYCVAFCAFLYSLTNSKRDALLCTALFFTVMSDTFLILVRPAMRGIAMTTFCVAQLLYALRLERMTRPTRKTAVRIVRAGLCVTAVCVAVLVLRDGADYLSLISVLYFANLLVNFIASFVTEKRSVPVTVGFALFILCDVFIGLQSAAGVYLDLAPSSVLYAVVFSDFNFAYLFYVPSQTLLALSGGELCRTV